MAVRNFVFDALVLRRWPIGDAHRGVAFLTRERGPVSAIAHGAAQAKGRLKLLTTPVRRVRLKAYHDPVADSWKVVDLEALDLYGGLGEDLGRAAVASLWAEILWRTQVEGQECEVFDLFTEGLALLNASAGAQTFRLHVLVLWRGLELMGLASDFSHCSECGRPMAGQGVAVPPPSGEPQCPDCSGGRGPWLSAAAVDWLLATAICSLEEAVAAPLDPADAAALASAAVDGWETALGSPLKSHRVFPASP